MSKEPTPFRKGLKGREERFLKYIEQKLTREEIAQREGLQSDYAGKLRGQIALKHFGVADFSDTKGSKRPIGLTKQTHELRYELGEFLYNLTDVRNMHWQQITREVGIPKNHQRIANGKFSKGEFFYDWNLSQIERMAKVHGMDVNKMLVLALRRELRTQAKAAGKGVGQLVEDWIKEKDNGIV